MGRISVNGVDLDAYGATLSRASTPWVLAPARSAATVIPGRRGSVRGEQWFGDGSCTLVLQVKGTGDVAAHDDLIAGLYALLGTGRDLLVRQTFGGGSVRQAVARLEASVTPEEYTPGRFARLTFPLVLPDVFWRDDSLPADHTETDPAGAFEVTTLAGASAPIEDALLLITGSANAPRLTDAGGSWVEFTSTLGVGEQVRIDCGAFTAVRGAGIGWAGAGSDATGLVSNGGPGSASRWLALVPQITGGDPTDRRITLTATGAAASVAIRARRAYL